MGSQRRHYSPDINEQILALQARGLPRAEIASQLGIPITKVHKLLSSRGAKLTPEQRSVIAAAARAKTTPTYAPDIHEQIDARRRRGRSLRSIADELGVTIGKVYVEAIVWSDYRLTPEQRADAHRKAPKEAPLKLGRKPLLSPEAEEQVVAARLAGETIRSLARSRGVSRSTIKVLLRSRGVFLSPERRQANAAAGQAPGHIEALSVASHSPEANAKRRATMRAKEYPPEYRQSVQTRTRSWWRGLSEEERAAYLERRKAAFDSSAAVAAHTERMRASKGDGALFLRSLLDRDGFETATQRCQAWAAAKGGVFVGPYVLSGLAAEWRCDKGHSFRARPNNVQQGTWCPACASCGPSKAQREIFDFVRGMASDAILDDRQLIRPKQLDIYVPSARLAIEYHGLYWHSSAAPGYSAGATARKVRMCWRAGAQIFVIFEDEWREKRQLVESMIRYRLGQPGKKLDARKLEMVEVQREEYERFFDANHLAGSTKATKAVGLRLGDELVACASFRPSFVDGTPEVARLAVLAGCSVRGAAGRLLSVGAYPGPLFSYSDNRMSRGDVYDRLGWVEEKTDRVGYWYVDDKFDNRIDRYSCRKRSDPEYLEIGSTEAEQNAAQGRYRIEDGGIRKWRRR